MDFEAIEPIPVWSVRRRPRSEAALVRAAQRGSADAFEQLYRANWPAAHRAAYLVVGDAQAAEDIAQEAFLAATRSLDRFDSRRPLGPWLHRIVVNRAIDWSRAKGPHPADLDAVSPASENPKRQVSDELLEALRSLSAEHRAIIVLRYLLGYRPGEIAAMLDLPRGTVNSRARRALDRLRPLLDEGGD